MLSDPEYLEYPGIEGEQENMAHPPINNPLPFYNGTKQWDLHEMQLKHWGIVSNIRQNRSWTTEWHKKVILLS